MTRSHYLCHLIDSPDIVTQLYLRFSSFLQSCKQSSNVIVNTCSNLQYSHSLFSRYVEVICHHLDCSKSHLYLLTERNSLKNAIFFHWLYDLNTENLAHASIIVTMPLFSAGSCVASALKGWSDVGANRKEWHGYYYCWSFRNAPCE
jgi:hypothetical protein